MNILINAFAAAGFAAGLYAFAFAIAVAG
jgi:hypothetical protein